MQTKSRGRHLWRRMVGVGLASAFAVVALVPTAAAAGNPVYTSASTVYTAVPAKGLVNVSVTMKIKNNYANGVQTVACDRPVWDEWFGWTTVPSTCKQSINYYINDGRLWVEKDATHLKVTSSGGSVKLSKDKASTAEYTAYKVTFPRIFKGQTRTVTATYTIKSGAPRSAAATRINGAYLKLYAITQPTDDASVKVIVPSTFESTTWGGALKSSTTGKSTTYSSGNVKDPAKYGVGIHGTNPNGFEETVITSAGGRQIELQAWPGDKEWLTAVTSAASGSISELEGLIGRPISGSGPVIIREAARDELGDAYVGQYDKDTQQASISEDYEQAGAVAHELAHAWFNSAMFDAIWLSEGHAEWAARSVGQTSAPCVAPATKPDLGNWQFADPRSTTDQRDSIADQYDAACAIVTAVANQVGADRMKEVFTVLSTDAGAYPGTTDTNPGAPNTWRQWLDAVEERGMVPAGQTDASPIEDDLVAYAIAPSTELTARSTARDSLATLREEAANGWTIPAAVYTPMEAWDFTSAGTAMTATTTTIADVDAVAAALPTVTVDANPIQDRLASAATLSELTTIGDLAAAQRATADQVAAAIERTHSANPLEAVGLIGSNVGTTSTAAVASVASLDLHGAKAGVADIEGTLQGAAFAGLVRMLVLMAGIALVSIVIWRRNRGDRNSEGASVASEAPMTPVKQAPGLATASIDDQPSAI